VGRRWRIAYSCSHLAGICAAVARGSAVSVLPASTMPKPFRRLGPEDGLPALPPLEIALLMPEHAHAVTRPLAAALRQSFGAG
jgi:DNA-binding transcriptional LysR family regulator